MLGNYQAVNVEMTKQDVSHQAVVPVDSSPQVLGAPLYVNNGGYMQPVAAAQQGPPGGMQYVPYAGQPYAAQATGYPQQGYAPVGGPGVPMNSVPPTEPKKPALICGIPAAYFGSAACGVCVVIIVVVVVLVTLFGGSPSNAPDDYYYHRIYEGSSCRGTPIYQYAYPAEACLTYYNTSLSQATSFKLLPSSSNTTKVMYGDDFCRTTETGRQATKPNECTTLANYPGYSMSTFYKSGQYQSLDNSLKVTGYQSRVCQSVGSMISYAFGKCIPRTPTTWVRYSYIPGYRTCDGTGERQVCTNYPAHRYEDTFTNSACSGGYNRVDLGDNSGCKLVANSETTSPYRSYDTQDCFQ